MKTYRVCLRLTHTEVVVIDAEGDCEAVDKALLTLPDDLEYDDVRVVYVEGGGLHSFMVG